MKVVRSSGTSVNFYQTRGSQIPKGSDHHSHHNEKDLFFLNLLEVLTETITTSHRDDKYYVNKTGMRMFQNVYMGLISI